MKVMHVEFGPGKVDGATDMCATAADDLKGQELASSLVQDGLDLLRSFREIPDRDVRHAVTVLVKALSRSSEV